MATTSSVEFSLEELDMRFSLHLLKCFSCDVSALFCEHSSHDVVDKDNEEC